MKRTVLISALAAATIVAASGTAMARMGEHGHGDAPRGPILNFEEVDANSDGKVTPEELEAHAAARFEAADTDGNGSLSAQELQARMQERATERLEERMARGAARIIERRDADDDGELSLEEMTPRNPDRIFSVLDANDDGAISAEEYEMAKAFRGKFGKQRHRQDD